MRYFIFSKVILYLSVAGFSFIYTFAGHSNEITKEKALDQISREYYKFRLEYSKKKKVNIKYLPKSTPEEIVNAVLSLSNEKLSVYNDGKKSKDILKNYMEKVLDKRVFDLSTLKEKRGFHHSSGIASVLPKQGKSDLLKGMNLQQVKVKQVEKIEKNSQSFLVRYRRYISVIMSVLVTLIVVFLYNSIKKHIEERK